VSPTRTASPPALHPASQPAPPPAPPAADDVTAAAPGAVAEIVVGTVGVVVGVVVGQANHRFASDAQLPQPDNVSARVTGSAILVDTPTELRVLKADDVTPTELRVLKTDDVTPTELRVLKTDDGGWAEWALNLSHIEFGSLCVQRKISEPDRINLALASKRCGSFFPTEIYHSRMSFSYQLTL
jgi:hypothetical protein